MRYRYGNADAVARAKEARVAVYRMAAHGNNTDWARRWKWRNEWVKIMEAERAAADTRLAEIWKGEPNGKAT